MRLQHSNIKQSLDDCAETQSRMNNKELLNEALEELINLVSIIIKLLKEEINEESNTTASEHGQG